jgi:hypothetical protein
MNKTIIAALIVLLVAGYSFAELRVDGEDVGQATNLVSGVDYLGLDNTTAFTPDADYEPATKKYVDDNSGSVTDFDDIGDPGANGTIAMAGTVQTFTFDTGSALRFQGTDAGDYWEFVYSAGNVLLRPVGGAFAQLGIFTIESDDVALQTTSGASSATVIQGENTDTSTYYPLIMAVNGADPYGTLGGQTNHWRFFTDGTLESVGTAMIEIPNSTSDMALTATKNLSFNYTDDQINIHMGSTGEAQGEVAVSVLQHIKMSFDPKAVCDGAVDRLFIMTVGDDAIEGIHITEWKVSFEADPTTEADLDLKYADAFIGVANAAVIDVLDTTTGASTEDTDANINSGTAIANGKVLYLEFGTAYTETTHQVIFEMWYYAEED